MPSLKRRSIFPKFKENLTIYFHPIFTEISKPSWMKYKIAHNKQVSEILTTELKNWFRSNNSGFSKKKLQTKMSAYIGWLFGSHPTAINLEDLEEAICNNKESKMLKFKLRIKFIKTKNSQTLSNVKGVYIHLVWSKMAKARKVFYRIYNKDAKEYPLGRRMWFVPDIRDSRFTTTCKTRNQVEKLVQKQKRYLEDTATAKLYKYANLIILYQS